jgi:ABC-type polysaccharide/polyol phosphate export permease
MKRAQIWSADNQLASGVNDIIESAENWRLWVHLAQLDMRARYRRTIIGPMWTTLSAVILILALGVVYSALWHVETRNFLPYFAAGYTTWLFFTTTLTEGATAFFSNASIITSIRLPISIHVFRLIFRNILVFLHIAVIYVLVVIWYQAFPNFMALLALPVGFLLFIVNLFWIGLLLATVCSRYRDVNQLLTNFIQIAFFITPIFWQVEILDSKPEIKFLLADLNPIYHLIELIRAPLIGRVPSLLTFGYTSSMAVIGLGFSIYAFSRYRGRIAFWV